MPPPAMQIEGILSAFPGLVSQANVIVVGTVVSLGSVHLDESRPPGYIPEAVRQNPDGSEDRLSNRVYYRDVQFAADTVVKGNPTPTLPVRIWNLSYARSLDLCERALVFLERGASRDGTPQDWYDVTVKYPVSADGTVDVSDSTHEATVPVEDFARFLRSFSRFTLPFGSVACPPIAVADQPSAISIATDSGQRLELQEGSPLFAEAVQAVDDMRAGADVTLDVPSSMMPLIRDDAIATEARFASVDVHAGGGDSPTDRVLINQPSLVGRTVIVNPSAPAESPLRAVGRLCAVADGSGPTISGLLQRLRVQEGGIILAAAGERGPFTVLSREASVLTAEEGPATNDQCWSVSPVGFAIQVPAYGQPHGIDRPPRSGDLVALTGIADPDRPSTVIAGCFHYGSTEETRPPTWTSDEMRRRFVEYAGRIYVPLMAGPADLEEWLTSTGDQIADGGETTYDAGADVFRIAGAADDLLVLRPPGTLEDRLDQNRRLTQFTWIDDSSDIDPWEQQIAYHLERGEAPTDDGRPRDPTDRKWTEYDGSFFREDDAVSPAPDEIELVDRIAPPRFDPETGMLEIFRWRDRPLTDGILVRRIFRFELGEYQIWRAMMVP